MREHVGMCYPIAEAMYHLLGGKRSGWTPQVVRLADGETHWFLRHRSGFLLDPTATQFIDTIPWEAGRGCGFLTKYPSTRARAVLKRLGKRP